MTTCVRFHSFKAVEALAGRSERNSPSSAPIASRRLQAPPDDSGRLANASTCTGDAYCPLPARFQVNRRACCCSARRHFIPSLRLRIFLVFFPFARLITACNSSFLPPQFASWRESRAHSGIPHRPSLLSPLLTSRPLTSLRSPCACFARSLNVTQAPSPLRRPAARSLGPARPRLPPRPSPYAPRRR